MTMLKLTDIAFELIARDEVALGFHTLVLAACIEAQNQGESVNFIRKHRKMLDDLGLVNIRRWKKEFIEELRKKKNFQYNPDNALHVNK